MLLSLPALTNPGRLAALHRVRLMDSAHDSCFDRIIRLAARFLDVHHGRVHQVLVNLLGNTTKCTVHGAIHVNVQAYALSTIKIPFMLAAETSVASTPEPLDVSHEQPAAEVILVAEDNLINQRLVLLQLRKLGYEAEAVCDGHEAVKAVQTGRYALVLMDCQMPGMDGLAATWAIRELERQIPGAFRLPIVALTANAMNGDREICLQAGMDDYLSKPVKVDVLDTTIKKWLSTRQ